MSHEQDEKHKVIEAITEIVSKMSLKSGIKLDGLSLRPKHELDTFSMGSGMTARTLERFRVDFPDEVIEHLIKNSGTTIFLGNGTSLAPLEISQRQTDGGLPPNPKIIIDQIDLTLLLEDLNAIEVQLQKKGFSNTFDIGQQRDRVKKLVEAAADKRQRVSIRTGLIGQAGFMDLQNSGDVVFNCFGPSIETLKHQLDLVKPGGILYATYYPHDFEQYADEIGAEALSMIESIDLMKKIVQVKKKSTQT